LSRGAGSANLDAVRGIGLASIAAVLLGCGGPAPTAGGGAAKEVRAPVRVDPPAGPGAMAPNLAATPGGGAVLTWLEPAGAGSHRLRFSRFSGGSWSEPVTVAEGPTIVANWADVPSAAETAGGVVVAHWAEAPSPGAHSYDVVLARSTDRGASWRRIGPAHDDATATEHGFATLVAEGERVRAFWLDGRATASDDGAMTLRTALIGERVEAGELLDPRVCDCCSTSAARVPGGVVLAYRDRTAEEVRDISVIAREAGARGGAWSAPRPVRHDGWRISGCPVNGPAVAAVGGDLAVAWYTYAAGRHGVRAAFSRDGGASFGPAVEVDGPAGKRAPLGRVGLVLEPTGEALISWMASGRDDAEILVRRVARDGRLGAEYRIARTRAERGSGVPRIAALGGDRLLAAWTELGPASHVRALLLPGRSIPPVGDASGPAIPRAGDAAGPVPGEAAPAYAARSLAGGPVSLADLRGRVVLLDVWATWCVPCRQELIDLAELHRQRAADGLAIVAVSVDDRAGRDAVAAFVRQRRLPFSVWLDPDDVASGVFGVRSLPTAILIGRDGTIRWRRDGAISLDDPDLRRTLDAALAQRSGP
jgi:peroxiredoxin